MTEPKFGILAWVNANGSRGLLSNRLVIDRRWIGREGIALGADGKPVVVLVGWYYRVSCDPSGVWYHEPRLSRFDPPSSHSWKSLVDLLNLSVELK